jgi:anti-sigma regulatory factor (Ser/Thr protein kinase)
MDLGITREIGVALDAMRQWGAAESGASEARIFPANKNALREVRRYILDRGVESSLPKEIVFDFMIAASEACANSVLYSNTSEVEIGWKVDADRVEAVIADRGVFRRGFPITQDGEPGRGRGMALMMALMDEVSVRRGTAERPGTLVRLIKRRI